MNIQQKAIIQIELNKYVNMKLVLTIYGITWLVFLLIFAVLRFKNRTFSFDPPSKKEKRLLVYALIAIIAFAPLVVLIIPLGLLIDRLVEYKKIKKINAEKEKEKKKRLLALHNYHSAIGQNKIKYTHDYANIASTLFTLAEDEKYDKLLSCLKGLTLQPGWVLDVDICKQSGLGDNSSLMVIKDNVKDFEIWKYINVKDDPMAVWQAYLLRTLWHALPYHWHGGYNRRTYIFTSKDIENIKFERPEESSNLIATISNQLEKITPEIIKYNDIYYITCCYWSDWGGLIRELIEIKVENNKIVNIFNVEDITLLKYNCGIIF